MINVKAATGREEPWMKKELLQGNGNEEVDVDLFKEAQSCSGLTIIFN